MRIIRIDENNQVNGDGLRCVIWFAGCGHKCDGCHNPETWDFDGGKEFTPETMNEIVDGLQANGIKRNLCIMGGEPLCSDNEFLTHLVIKTVKDKLPNVPIYIWTGYTYEELARQGGHMAHILKMADYLIDGPYIESLRNVTLEMRGSSNQRIINLREIDKV